MALSGNAPYLRCRHPGPRPMSSPQNQTPPFVLDAAGVRISQRWQRAALCAAAGAGARQRLREETHQSRGQLVRQLLRLLRGRDFLWLGLGCAGLVLSSLAELASPPLAAAALFSAVQGRHHLLLPRCAAVAGVAVLSGAAEGLRNFSFNMLRSNLVARLRQEAFGVLMSQELSFFDEADGELTSRLSSDCMSVYSYLSDVLSFFLRSGAVALCSLLELLRLSPSITWRVLLMLTLVMVCAEWYGRVTRSTGRKTQDALAELGRISSEALQLLRTVRALGAEDLHKRLFKQQNAVINETQRRRGMALGIFSAASNGLGLLLQMVSLLIGSSLVLAGSMTAQALATYLLYLDTAVDSALELGIEWSSCNDALGSAERVLRLLADGPVFEPAGHCPGAVSGDVLFDSVSFTYPSRPKHQVLEKVSLHCAAGKTTALVGFSGSGKSSLISLLLRFYDLEDGQGILKFDNADVRHLDRVWLRRQMGLVPQSPKLFRGTIAENIAWGQPCVTQAEVHAAAEAAMAAEFIAELPEGFDTICSDEKLLSGGQRQRIALARALFRDPAAKWSESRKCPRTMIIVAHDLRLGAVQSADQIVVMDGGRILERGGHAELLELNGSYKRLMEDQRLPTEHTPRI
ncbi:unnamed protein product [Durusdinium trenchii]|uniref:Uncharacterized protein n=1 Tax=Durusdinium trenchii TaxID=1381693 RepID=A0ABP0NLS2_9DINO